MQGIQFRRLARSWWQIEGNDFGETTTKRLGILVVGGLPVLVVVAGGIVKRWTEAENNNTRHQIRKQKRFGTGFERSLSGNCSELSQFVFVWRRVSPFIVLFSPCRRLPPLSSFYRLCQLLKKNVEARDGRSPTADVDKLSTYWLSVDFVSTFSTFCRLCFLCSAVLFLVCLFCSCELLLLFFFKCFCSCTWYLKLFQHKIVSQHLFGPAHDACHFFNTKWFSKYVYLMFSLILFPRTGEEHEVT